MTEPRPLQLFTGGTSLAATLHRSVPDLVEPQPTIVISGSWLTVKEQMADLYAARLAQRGYTVVTFDFAGFGASDGAPRQAELPARKIDDMITATRAVSTLSFVRPGAIGYLAVCASAQYAVRAIAAGAPIDAFASVAGWYHDARTVAPFYGGDDGVALRLERGEEALAAYQRTGEVRTVPAYEAGNDRAGMFFELDYYGSPKRGAVSNWVNEMAELSWVYWLTFDGLSAARQVRVPSLFVHGDGCVLPENLRAVAGNVAGPAETVWAEGTQIDFYDQDPQVTLAVDAVDAHFRAHLAGTSG
ncbi:alpha/beta hydrolase [Pseudonocardia sp. DSM 110487]|uniref:alpha/beta hydrolase n=1 Tax=Pseudonocardia sp. DSM 110487 TaxID=2865833 RepID=UPI001C6A1906|nr:alpha/beta hydrolase [Pseudonocardia sp. DSM 110487]QYN32201.1 alpha/beta hydrolase [Pseudonocardia sp. DSM 110487]